MAFAMNNKKNANLFWRFSNLSMWILLAILTLGAFPLFRYIRSQLEKNKEQKDKLDKDANWTENLNPLTVQQKADKITTRKDVQNAAKELAHNLGTKYSDENNWYDIFNPKGWTENDKAIADILIFQRANYAYLKKLYTQCYTNSLDLSADLVRLLDDDEKKRVSKYLKI
jgi:hypothetical protein